MNREKLYQAALSFDGKDAHTDNLAPAALACADSVNTVYRSVFGRNIGGGASTEAMYESMLGDESFAQESEPMPGDVIISPTGYVSTPHGHVGIVGEEGLVHSNNSDTGLFDTHLSLATWPFDFTRYFRCVDPANPIGLPNQGSQALADTPQVASLKAQLVSLMRQLVAALQAKLSGKQ